MKYVTVFCGSAEGKEKIYREQAFELGKALVRHDYGLVYGGAHVGLMGAVADGVLDAGGDVIGVIPRFLEKKELAHSGVKTNYLVETMHERKAKMDELSHAVIALPGGFGTMDELFEMLTWGQLALHRKPIGLLNTENYYDPLMAFVDQMIEKRFVKAEYRDMMLVDNNIEQLLNKMEHYVAPLNDKWFEPALK
ncbi:TIGR00730 family Rossman fold protein [Dysgonomonas massiliensis]|uniref:LOG family protein n=1 Tax=Dysgonomonas massiliensis TaxID=2040292 RepID=UPI000C775E64|nr:TIGR00730 family Rossman fold protein [Dysgonomonas massiliensis]